MYDALKNGEALTVSGAVAERFCEEYVQTITEDGENFYMPQDYPLHSTVDMMKYDMRGILNKINPIYDKLGIERQFSGRNNSTGSFFGNNQRNFGTSEHRSLDDISARFEDDDE